jgi:hypothetical protein
MNTSWYVIDGSYRSGNELLIKGNRITNETGFDSAHPTCTLNNASRHPA